MQKKFNTYTEEYRQLESNYNKISDDYARVVSELQNSRNNQSEPEISDLHQQLEMADAKLQELYA